MSKPCRKILVPTSGYVAAKGRSDYIIEVARRVGAEVHVLHIRDPKFVTATSKESEAWEALKLFQEKGAQAGVCVSSHFVSGELVPTMVAFANDNDFDMILIGASSGGMIAPWVISEVMASCEVPVLIIPQDLDEMVKLI